MISIDGSHLEGGGQILRIAISLSGLLRKPIQVYNIRANRPKPGLSAQHLLGIQLANQITCGELTGDQIGSCSITFKPNTICGGFYRGDAKTAGSVTLLLQALLPLLVYTPEPTSLELCGGTHVPMAPFVDYTTSVLKPVLNRHGINFDVQTIRQGYYPKGGGVVQVNVVPICQPIKPIVMCCFGNIINFKIFSFVGHHLHYNFAKEIENKTKELLSQFGKPTFGNSYRQEQAWGKNFGLSIIAETDTGCYISSSSLGKPNQTSDMIAQETIEQLFVELNTKCPVDSHTQDQLIVFMALAEGTSKILTGPITTHTQTAIYVAELITGIKFTIKPHDTDPGLNYIECTGMAYQLI